MKVSLLVPTRQRRDGLLRMYSTAMDTANAPKQVEVIAYVDDDDHSYDDLKEARLTIIRGPRIILSEAWNACYKAAKGS